MLKTSLKSLLFVKIKSQIWPKKAKYCIYSNRHGHIINIAIKLTPSRTRHFLINASPELTLHGINAAALNDQLNIKLRYYQKFKKTL